MNIDDKGVLDGSVMDYVAPSKFALEALYYTKQYGHFHCDKQYRVERPFMDAMLMVLVQSGELVIETRGQCHRIQAQQIALVDCKYAHWYACDSAVDFLWFHFDGSASQAYYDLLFAENKWRCDASSRPHLKRHFDAIYLAQQSLDYREHEVSSQIHALLSQLAMEQRTTTLKRSLHDTLEYIHSHFASPLTVDGLAQASYMSVSQFIRAFKRYARTTPHDYILGYRLRQAKHLLTQTDHTIDSIADECGFSSASHFTRAFRKANQLTPSQYRGRA